MSGDSARQVACVDYYSCPRFSGGFFSSVRQVKSNQEPANNFVSLLHTIPHLTVECDLLNVECDLKCDRL